jgi:hypothetical protein
MSMIGFGSRSPDGRPHTGHVGRRQPDALRNGDVLVAILAVLS